MTKLDDLTVLYSQKYKCQAQSTVQTVIQYKLRMIRVQGTGILDCAFSYSRVNCLLKGQCHEIFYLWFFSSNNFSWPQKTRLVTISIFFEYSRRYSIISGASPVSTTPAMHALPVSLTPVNNSLPVSTTPVSDTFIVFLESFTGVNDTGKKFLTGVIDTSKACIHRCQ